MTITVCELEAMAGKFVSFPSYNMHGFSIVCDVNVYRRAIEDIDVVLWRYPTNMKIAEISNLRCRPRPTITCKSPL